MKKKALDKIFRIIPVMIGVYLGFVVTNWGEQQKIGKKSRILKTNIISEIQVNWNKVEAMQDYHKALWDSSNRYLVQLNGNPLKRPPQYFRGIQSPTLISSAYNTGSQTGIIIHFDLNTIQALNQLYTSQQVYNRINQITMERIMDLDFSTQEKTIRNLLQNPPVFMTDIVNKKTELLHLYKLNLEQLDRIA